MRSGIKGISQLANIEECGKIQKCLYLIIEIMNGRNITVNISSMDNSLPRREYKKRCIQPLFRRIHPLII